MSLSFVAVDDVDAKRPSQPTSITIGASGASPNSLPGTDVDDVALPCNAQPLIAVSLTPPLDDFIRASAAAAAPLENGNSRGNVTSSVTDGESSNLETKEPSWSSSSQRPLPNSKLMTVLTITDDLLPTTLCSTGAPPSSSHVLQQSTASGDSYPEAKTTRTVAEKVLDSSPSGFTFLKDDAQTPFEGFNSAAEPPSTRQEHCVTADAASAEGEVAQCCADPVGEVLITAIKRGSAATSLISVAAGGAEKRREDSHDTFPPNPLLFTSEEVPVLNLATPLMPGMVRAAATTVAGAAESLTTTTATTTVSATSSAGINPRTTSLPVIYTVPSKASDNREKHISFSTPLFSSNSICSSSGSRFSHLNPPARITAWIRSRVSQNKVRFRDGDFNLDLTYITPRIIAMGYPAHGTEYYIRNPIDEVERFFDRRHAGHFCIYNLCSERAYDKPNRFHGCFRRFAFDDHNVPSLSLILQFVLDATTFLDSDESNVVAIHCKAGKGRTGIMVSCLLYYLYPDKFATANEAIHFFDQQRTLDGEGMTIPSQRRYVNYFERIVRDFHGVMPTVQRKLTIKEVVIRVAHQNTILHPCDLYFIASNHRQKLLDSRVWFPRGPAISSEGCRFSFETLKEASASSLLVGDIKFSFFRRRPIVLSGKESTACYLWFNTTLCPSLEMVYRKTELDKVDVSAVGKTVVVSLSFSEVA